MKRRAFILIVVGLASLAVAGGASAQQPDREVVPVDDQFTTDECGFPVMVEIEGTIINTEFKKREVEVYPGYTATLTNVQTTESLVVPIPGPWFINPDGSDHGTGSWVYLVSPLTGEPGLFLLRGRWVNEAGELTFVGHLVDLCAELAPG